MILAGKTSERTASRTLILLRRRRQSAATRQREQPTRRVLVRLVIRVLFPRDGFGERRRALEQQYQQNRSDERGREERLGL